MKVSVIITTYNRPHYLKRTIEGYLNQTYQDFEIVIADDGSTEETANAIKELTINSGKKILHVWQEDKGFRAASIRNKAIARSDGVYLIMADDDSIPSRHLIEDHLQYAQSNFFIQGHRVLLGVKASEYFIYSQLSPFKLFCFFLKGEVKNSPNLFRLPWPLISISQGLKGIRSCNLSMFREDFFRVNGFNEDFEGWGKEDSELVLRLFKAGLKRKDIKFRASCFHLYHRFYDRDRLEKNIELLRQSTNNNHYLCRNGIDKYCNYRSPEIKLH